MSQPAKLFEKSNNLIEQAYLEKNIKILKAGNRDINEQVRHMPLSAALELKKLFKEKLDIDFDEADKLRAQKLTRILKTGKISNPEEYELLLNRVDEIYSDKKLVNELRVLNQLLMQYDK